MRRTLALVFGTTLLLAPRPAAAEPSFQVFPPSNLYPGYVADPRRPEFGLTFLAVPDPAIPDSGDQRFGLKMGGRFGLLRVRGWQFDIEAGFTGQFDIDHSLDNIGWDGTYAFLLSRELGEGLAVQAGGKHISSHVGDEYAERTGRRRIDYTREEITAGLSWVAAPGWRTYAEAGWSFEPREDVGQEPGRLQVGLEHEAPGSLPGGRVGWYAAMDLGALEERGWQVDPTLQAGFLIPSGHRLWRVGLGYHDGTVPIGELFQVDERYVVLGLWLSP